MTGLDGSRVVLECLEQVLLMKGFFCYPALAE